MATLVVTEDCRKCGALIDVPYMISAELLAKIRLGGDPQDVHRSMTDVVRPEDRCPQCKGRGRREYPVSSLPVKCGPETR
jgi:hypothetical protein